jgi:hypothetical protein
MFVVFLFYSASTLACLRTRKRSRSRRSRSPRSKSWTFSLIPYLYDWSWMIIKWRFYFLAKFVPIVFQSYITTNS